MAACKSSVGSGDWKSLAQDDLSDLPDGSLRDPASRHKEDAIKEDTCNQPQSFIHMCFHIHTPSSKKCVKGSCTGLHSLQLRKVQFLPCVRLPVPQRFSELLFLQSSYVYTEISVVWVCISVSGIEHLFMCLPIPCKFSVQILCLYFVWFLKLNLTVRLWLALNLLYRRS